MKFEKKYSIQEFANMCHTTKDTLFHYHRMKLIKPSINESNHYREYTSEHLLTFHRIALLKKSGCTLEEIEDYLYHRNANTLPTILEESHVRLNQKLLEAQRAVQQLNRIEEAIIYAQTPKNAAPHVEIWTEPRYLVTTPIDEADFIYDEADITCLCSHIDYCETIPTADAFPIGNTLPNLSLSMELYSHAFFSFSKEPFDSDRCQVLEPGKYLCSLHIGCLDFIQHSIESLAQYAFDNNILPIGNLYVCNLIDAFTVFDRNDFVTWLFSRIE
ncbi:MerR family transcriptional regulator [Oscillibacter valericigenes]|uniref:MerR family transcriptional regulator n=1 Tax=Oscillibacter valericigenes TaxID=351091 RepID=UPI001F2B3E03|nr:MerR family transcriptional regulator [Oscillibacter valericigenes]MCF2665188.1 MerR family transcriptional regulator [Oscillibacter valericigenes]